MMKFNVEDCLILKYIGGSHAYGTNVVESDIDYRGIVIPPKSYFLGLDKFEQYESKNPDVVYCGIEKMVRLALTGNPNILEGLFVDSYIVMTSYGERLISIRNEFLTKCCTRAHTGYAQHQIRTIDTKPIPASRSRRRMCLIEKYGYDTKFALHIFRLLKTCIEILREGVLRVRRPDAKWLLEILNGRYKLEEIKTMSNDLIDEIRKVEQDSNLPDGPNYEKINETLISIVEEHLKSK